MKYWTEANQIILVTSDKILFGHYSQKVIKEFTVQLDNEVISDQLTGIPLHYIKEIHLDDRKMNIEFELGKGSIEKITFKSKELRNAVFDYIKDNFKIFRQTRPSSTRIWKRYLMTLILILFLTSLLLYSGKLSGYSPGAKAIGILRSLIKETFDTTTIIVIVIFIAIWRTVILTLDLKALEKTFRLSR